MARWGRVVKKPNGKFECIAVAADTLQPGDYAVMARGIGASTYIDYPRGEVDTALRDAIDFANDLSVDAMQQMMLLERSQGRTFSSEENEMRFFKAQERFGKIWNSVFRKIDGGASVKRGLSSRAERVRGVDDSVTRNGIALWETIQEMKGETVPEAPHSMSQAA